MKKVISFIILIIMFSAFGTMADADELKYGDLYYCINDDGSVYITGSVDGAKNIVIPSEIDGMPVTGVAAYSQWDNIESIEIPDSVIHIGDYAFGSEYYLTKIKGGNNIEYVGRWGFQSTGYEKDKSNYKNGVLYAGSAVIGYDKDTVPSKVQILSGTKCIGGNAFSGCKTICEVVLPESVKSICEEAFENCTSLEKINIPDSIELIDEEVFLNSAIYNDEDNWENGVLYIGNSLIKADKNLSGAVKIKEGTKVIADEAFYQRRSITEIELPEGVQYVGRSAFWNCAFTVLKLPSTLKKIDFYAFEECNSLESIYIADVESYLSIDMREAPMRYATKLYIGGKRAKNIEIPETITAIPPYAFANCTQLEKIIIPKSVTEIKNNAFYNAGADVLECTVEYEGSREDFANMYIGNSGNEFFERAKINYNSPFAADISENPISYTKELKNGIYCFDVNVSKVAENCFVYVSIYNENDKIIAIKKAAIDEMGNAKVYINQQSGESYAKIFAWHSTQPISKAEKEEM